MTTALSFDTDALLHKLSSDDAFRARMMKDPAAALESIGISLSPTEIPQTIQLPSKESIARDRQALLSKLDNSAGAIPFLLSGKL